MLFSTLSTSPLCQSCNHAHHGSQNWYPHLRVAVHHFEHAQRASIASRLPLCADNNHLPCFCHCSLDFAIILILLLVFLLFLLNFLVLSMPPFIECFLLLFITPLFFDFLDFILLDTDGGGLGGRGRSSQKSSIPSVSSIKSIVFSNEEVGDDVR